MTSAKLKRADERRETEFMDVTAEHRWAADPPLTRTVLLSEPTELWLRTPAKYLRVVQQVNASMFVYNRRTVMQKHYQVWKQLSDILPPENNWRCWIVAREEAKLYTREISKPNRSGMMKTARIAPVWHAEDSPADLEKLCRAYDKQGWDRIFITGTTIQAQRTGDEKLDQVRTLDYLHRLGSAYPNVNLHLHGEVKFRVMFGLNFRSADFDPAALFPFRNIVLPNGQIVAASSANRHLKWIHVVGWSAKDIVKNDIDSMARFNLDSAHWAAENYSSTAPLPSTLAEKRADPMGLFNKNKPIARMPPKNPIKRRFIAPKLDPDQVPQMVSADNGIEPYHMAEPVIGLPPVPVKPRKDTTYDKILCDPCSLRDKCRYVREGGVCILPGSPSAGLARLFLSRDADEIRTALAAVLNHQAQRLERVSEAWDSDEVTDLATGEVIARSEHQMKLENSLARGAEAMIKILDPAQRINTIVPALAGSTVHVYNPSVLVADTVKRLEAAGVGRDAIDPAAMLEAAREQGIIDAEVEDE